MTDYRCTSFCLPFQDIVKKKKVLGDEISRKHRQSRNHYSYISKRGTEEHSSFVKIFNEKCGYCGCSLDIVPVSLFEIDHIEPASRVVDSERNLNDIENLVLACRTCNGGKLDFWTQELGSTWRPDDGGICQVFERDELYNIKVASDYADNIKAKELFERLKLNGQIRRLDYLLMSMLGYIETLSSDDPKKAKLQEVYIQLLNKRNRICV